MRNPVYILLAVVALSLLLTNCGGDRAAERQLREADAVMNSAPDSALSILTSMVKLRTANPGLYATVSGDLFGVPSEKK